MFFPVKLGTAPDKVCREPVFDELRAEIGEDSFGKVMEQLRERLSYSPVIVFMGKTGAGKSSLCNALFGKDAFKVSDVAVGTRGIQIETTPDGLILVDVPGVGEGGEPSKTYEKLYHEILHSGVQDSRSRVRHEVDAIVWLIKSNDRALQIDKGFFDTMFKRLCTPEQLTRLTVAVSQADAIEPIRGEGSWDNSASRPGVKQAKNLDEKRRQIAAMFDAESNHIVDFSAEERYNLDRLLERVVNTLPPGRAPLVVDVAEKAAERVNQGRPEGKRSPSVVTPVTQERVDRDIWEGFVEAVKKVLPSVLATTVVKSIPKIVKAIKSLF